MFSVNRLTEDGFDKVVLKDETTGTIAAVVPGCGAILQEFSIIKDGKKLNVISSYESADDFRKNITSKGFMGAKLSPFVCRLKKGKYDFDGKEYRIRKYYNGNHALHGILFDQPFRILQENAGENKASVSMIHEYRAIDPGYPFFYDCIITYELELDNTLHVSTEMVNKDEVKIPVQDGWHPYFTLGDSVNELELQFHSKDRVEFNEELIPTGELTPYTNFSSVTKLGDTVLDNSFTIDRAKGSPVCLLRNPGKKVQVEIEPGESYPFLQIYTPPHRQSIAIENISGTPNGFNNGSMKVLAPGESATFKTAYKINSTT